MSRITRAVLFVAGCFVLIYVALTHATSLSGRQFKDLVQRSYTESYSYWYLYFEDESRYCFKVPRPLVPKRYCVSKKEIIIRNAGGTSQIAYVYEGEFFLITHDGKAPSAF